MVGLVLFRRLIARGTEFAMIDHPAGEHWTVITHEPQATVIGHLGTRESAFSRARELRAEGRKVSVERSTNADDTQVVVGVDDALPA